MNAINYRMMDTMEEMTLTEELQQLVWGMSPLETLSSATIRWMLHIGGLLLGAWDEDQLVGFCIGSPGKREGKWVFWSDMAGIHPNYQGQNIGYHLKLKQREWVCEQGYDEIRWTFDPMRRGNAHFNFHKLGVISYLYHPGFYGDMQDDINKGLPADRLEAIWSTQGTQSKPFHDISNATPVVEYDGQTVHTHPSNHKTIAIHIPYDLNTLKSANLPLAIKWQQAVRQAFLNYFEEHYQAVDFVKGDHTCWYILSQ